MRKLLALLIGLSFLTILVACNVDVDTIDEPEIEPTEITLDSFELIVKIKDTEDKETNEDDESVDNNIEEPEDGESEEIQMNEHEFVFVLNPVGVEGEESVVVPMPAKNELVLMTEGTAAFGSIKFTETGVFRYEILQVIPDIETEEDADEKNKGSWELDDIVYSITVTISDDEDILMSEVVITDSENHVANEIIFVNEFFEIEEEYDDNEDDATENEVSEIDEQSENILDTAINNPHIDTPSDSTSSTHVDTHVTNSPNNTNAGNDTNSSSNSNHVCTNVWVETSPAVPAVPGTPAIEEVWEMTPPDYVMTVWPSGTQFRDNEARRQYMLENNSTSFTTHDIGSQWVLVQPYVPTVPGTHAIPAQGHWECR